MSGDPLSLLMQPRSIALVGASRTPGKIGHALLANLLGLGFPGTIYPINPYAEEILGRRCHPSIRECREPVDLAILAVPASSTLALAREAIQARCRSLVVIADGFREKGEEGAVLEEALARLCREHDVPLLGPNSLGLINVHARLNASFSITVPPPGGVSILSQSGAVATATLDWMAARGLGLAKMISLGNQADLTESDFLEYLARDPETQVIACYLEGVEKGESFLKAAELAAQCKPLIIHKVGQSGAGKRAVQGHTGACPGAERAYVAACQRVGAVRVESHDAWLDAMVCMARQPLPVGNRVAVVTNAGGPGVMAADSLEQLGLQVPSFSEETLRQLAEALPAASLLHNPLDLMGNAQPEDYARAMQILSTDDAVDAILVIMTPQSMTRPVETAQVLHHPEGWGKPVLAVFMGGIRIMASYIELNIANIPNYPSPERAARALAAARRYSAWLHRPPRVITHFPVNRRRVQRLLNRYQDGSSSRVAVAEGRELLQAYGMAVPEGGLATSLDEALDWVDRLGYPVVLRLSSPDFDGISENEYVRSHLSSLEGVKDAFDLMAMRFAKRHPQGRFDGICVERVVVGDRQVVIGMRRDPQFGPLLLFGLRGTFVEVMDGPTIHLAPVTADEAMEMMAATRIYPLLQGGEGEPDAVDLRAIAESLQRLSQLATDFPEIAKIDIDPLVVGRPGYPPQAVGHMILLDEKRH
ncbi:MAG: acetate--CoA ligase family protein [Magnetococcales bacterium]|nr:acetate--CoA ligase family protein [Magnetococcales bacterium]